jgi:hypothetical protein
MIRISSQLAALSVIYVYEEGAAIGAIECADSMSHFHELDYSVAVRAGPKPRPGGRHPKFVTVLYALLTGTLMGYNQLLVG